MALFLPNSSWKAQVITTAAGQIDVHASWADLSSGSTTVGGTNTRISTAATTDIVAAPAASTARNIRNLKIGNTHATVTNTVSLILTDGTTAIEVEKVILAAGERMGYEEGVGVRVFDAAGREKSQWLSSPGGNSNTSDVTANGANTFLTGSSLPIGGRVQAGSFFKWRMRATKTGAGTAVPTIAVTTGPNATTADTARVTHSGAAQTATSDTGHFEVDAIFRSVGATAVIESFIRMDHTQSDANGFGTYRYLSALSSSFALGASDYIGLTCNPGASGVWTFQHVLIDSGNLIA